MHPLVLGLFHDRTAAAAAARALRDLGVDRERLSVVTRSHDDEVRFARRVDASPGTEIEDSRPAARLGELGAHVLTAIAVVMPGIGPIVGAGPLSADLGEAAGHYAGGVASVLTSAGLSEDRGRAWQSAIEHGAVILGAHVRDGDTVLVTDAMRGAGADQVELAEWRD